jgi:hypothetical protein
VTAERVELAEKLALIERRYSRQPLMKTVKTFSRMEAKQT